MTTALSTTTIPEITESETTLTTSTTLTTVTTMSNSTTLTTLSAAPTASPTNATILIIYDSPTSRKDNYLLYPDGDFRILDDFVNEDDISTYGSCSLMLRGSMMLFGGTGSYTRQLLSVGDCSLKLEGQLPF